MSAPGGVEAAGHDGGQVPALMYHSVATGAAPGFRRFTLDPGEFSAQMDYLRATGYHPITAAQLAASRSSSHPLPPRPVVLTFDDALTDFYRTALPVLLDHGFTATLFVPTAYAGSTARWLRDCGEEDRLVLSWQELREVAAEGVEVGSHSHTHRQLDRAPGAVVRNEAARSRALLEDHLGRPVSGFAYPYGYWNRAVRAAVATAGFSYAFAVAELPTATTDHVLSMPRLTVSAGLGVAGLASLLGDRSTASRRGAAAAKRVAWRRLRRGGRDLGGDLREAAAR